MKRLLEYFFWPRLKKAEAIDLLVRASRTLTKGERS
jgi:hypothetical protein